MSIRVFEVMRTVKCAVLLCMFLSGEAYALPDVKVTLKVIDGAGQPIEGASASVNFKAGTEGNTETESTDSDGLATLSGSSTRFVEYGAGKEGYYPTWYQKSYTKFTGTTGFRRWQPWNETLTLVLKKIKEPRALYISDHRGGSKEYAPSLEIPGLDREYGYDLIVRDWVGRFQGSCRLKLKITPPFLSLFLDSGELRLLDPSS